MAAASSGRGPADSGRKNPVTLSRSFLSGTRRPDGEFNETVTTTKKAWREKHRRTIYSVNGDQFTGEWKTDLKHGFGLYVWDNGDRYEGEWEVDMRQGQGAFWVKLPDGRQHLQYTGGWQNDKRHGLGTYYWEDGNIYEGEWIAGQRAGWGTMSYANGERYEGEFKDDVRCGFGKYFYANGNIYEGHWDLDKKDGEGCFYFVERNKMYQGEWLAGEAKAGIVTDIELSENPALKRLGVPRLGLTNEKAAQIIQKRLEEVQEDREKLHADRIDAAREEAAAAAREKALQDIEDHRIGGKFTKRDTKQKAWQTVV